MVQIDQPGKEAATFVALSCNVAQLPDENLATLSRMEFQVLQDGEINGAKAGRDLCLGFLVSGAIGLVGLFATVDWNGAFHNVHLAPFLFTGLLLAITAASGLGAWIYHRRFKSVQKSSAYSTLMTRLRNHFGNPT